MATELSGQDQWGQSGSSPPNQGNSWFSSELGATGHKDGLYSLERSKEVVNRVAKVFEDTTGLNVMDCRTVTYWAAATHGLPELKKFPILSIFGAMGTGKTTILEILRSVSREPVWLQGDNTRAVARDEVGALTTALIDEGDSFSERLLINRYAVQSSVRVINRATANSWAKDRVSLFGATALHRRKPFKDPAVLSRAITVSTSRKQGVLPLRVDSLTDLVEPLAELARQISWSAIPDSLGSRIGDTWEPVLSVGKMLGDEAWLIFAEQQKRKADQDYVLGHGEEPREVVIKALMALAIQDEREVLKRVLVGAITARVREEGQSLNSWQIGSILREVGFDVTVAGGNQYAYSGGADQLIEICDRMGIEDEWVDTNRQTLPGMKVLEKKILSFHTLSAVGLRGARRGGSLRVLDLCVQRNQAESNQTIRWKVTPERPRVSLGVTLSMEFAGINRN